VTGQKLNMTLAAGDCCYKKKQSYKKVEGFCLPTLFLRK